MFRLLNIWIIYGKPNKTGCKVVRSMHLRARQIYFYYLWDTEQVTKVYEPQPWNEKNNASLPGQLWGLNEISMDKVPWVVSSSGSDYYYYYHCCKHCSRLLLFLLIPTASRPELLKGSSENRSECRSTLTLRISFSLTDFFFVVRLSWWRNDDTNLHFVPVLKVLVDK